MTIKIDGVHLENDLGLRVTIDGTEDELLPEVQEYSVNVPGRHGEYSFKSWMQPRNFSVRVLIPPQDTRISAQLVARELSRMFLNEFGNPKEVELIFDHDPDKFYTVKLSSNMAIERIRKAGFAEFELKAYDPYAYTTFHNDDVVWGSSDIFFSNTTLTYGMEGAGGAGINIHYPTSFNVSVGGFAVKPLITIIGSAESLTIDSNGYTIKLPSFSETVWEIDCDKYTVIKNGVNSFGDVSLRNFVLGVGLNEVKVTGSFIDVNIKITFRDKYL